MKGILNAELQTLEDAQEAARHLKRIESENIKMKNQTVAPVLPFISVHYTPPKLLLHLQRELYIFISNNWYFWTLGCQFSNFNGMHNQKCLNLQK